MVRTLLGGFNALLGFIVYWEDKKYVIKAGWVRGRLKGYKGYDAMLKI